MHEMFLNTYHVNVPYKVYWSIFTQESGLPPSDTYSICDTLAIKINHPERSIEESKKLETEKRSDSVSMFAYHEGDGRKGSNEVTSMLLTYVNNNNQPLDNLVLISDSCCGQNNN
ncbi:hypothetical protein PR048_000630 [Dryococelus australis]|uniref:Uncharacterized protein n=1 Tax=Dryococelus australis TaxID=614101 RepID=A0ABQ9IF63_9NEOP|nr:hypothetical protein PR048_000630 [Dryococelus australis]